MGTNYYVHANPCDTCLRHDVIHIGKQSGGWAFIFSPDKESFKAWKVVLDKHQGAIYNEYGDRVLYEDFLAMVEENKNKTWAGNSSNITDRARADESEYKDPEGYRFCKQRGFS
jgi:hypothetical protein